MFLAMGGTAFVIAGLAGLCVKLYGDSRRHRRTSKRLRDSEARLRTILDTSPLALAIHRLSDHCLTYANPRWCDLFGCLAQHHGAGGGRDLYADPVDCTSLCRMALDLGYVPEYECRMRRRDGSEFWALLSATRIDEDGVEALCISVTDISKRKEHESLLALAKSQAEETSRAKSLFLATMSHEIRTPMNGVMTMANLLQDMPMSSEQREMARIIYDSSNSLLCIINDILDFSKIEAGRLHLETVEFSLLDVVEGVAELLAPRAFDKGIEFISDVAPHLPDQWLGDPVRLRQILTNLAGNAVKFTERGYVRISVDGRLDDGSNFYLTIKVEDTGIGLDAEQQSRLFAPFSQADATIARRYGGTGLGLSISQRLVDMMGGTIGVDSQPGRGATFWFSVPVMQSHHQADPSLDVAGTDILLVSDSACLIGSIQPVLQHHGCQLAIASRADGGLSAIRAAQLAGWSYDMVLVDCGGDWRWGMDVAFSLMSAVDQRPAISLMLPGAQSSVAAADVQKAGLLPPLCLPVRRSVLVRQVAAAAGRISLDDLDGVTAEQEIYSPPTIEEAAAADALILVAEDNLTNQAVIRRLMHRLGFAAEIVANGQEAWQRLQIRDYGLLFTDCHMPGMDGYQLAARVRAAEADGGRRTPIIALTADVLSGTATRCHQAGMDGIVAKPIDLSELENTVRRLLPVALTLRRRQESQIVSAGPAVSDDKGTGTPVLDLTPIRLIFGTINQDAKDLLRLFVSSTRPLVDEIQHNVRAENWTEAGEAAHGAKGAANSAGCYQFAHLCADMEAACFGGHHTQAMTLALPLESAFDLAEQAIEALQV